MRSSTACDVRAWFTLLAMVGAAGGLVFVCRWLMAPTFEQQRREGRRLLIVVLVMLIGFAVSASISWDGSECVREVSGVDQ